MLKVLIVSDTHRKDDVFWEVWKKEAPCGMVLCAGDAEGSETDFQSIVSPAEFHYAAGNNDFFTDAPMEEEFRIGPYKCLLTHGHLYRVSMTEELLAGEAASRGCDLAVYGHTHKPVIHRVQGVLVMNPGSLGYPRQPGRKPTYIVMTIGGDGMLSAKIRFLR